MATLVKIEGNAKFLSKTKFQEVGGGTTLPPSPVQIPLIVGTNSLGTHGDSINIPLIANATFPLTLPYTVTAGLLKGLRITTTPTLSTDILAAALARDADVFSIQNDGGSFIPYFISSDGRILNNRTPVPNAALAPNRNMSILVRGNSPLRVWYKWPAGQWV